MDESTINRCRQLELENLKLKKEVANYQNLIEENKKLQEKHFQSQLRFKTIFDESSLGNKILDENLSIIEANHAFISLLGYTDKNDIVNRKIIEFSHPDFIEHWKQLQVKLWKEKISTFSLDACLVKKDRTSIWCRVTSILFDDQGKTLGYTIVENINERKTLEIKAERLYQAQEIVVNMVAHDLRSPLNTIEQLSGIIRSNIGKDEKDKALTHLTLLDKTCNRNKIILNDLLLIGELELEKKELPKQKVDIAEILRSAVEQSMPMAKKKSIELNSATTLPVLFAEVNKEKLFRVMENLLSNAIKFTRSGGSIETALKQEESSFLVVIKDTGIGIPEESKSSLFNKFTKAKRKGTQGEQTTGLGLFISKRIVEMHGGKIWFESALNEGTSFYVRIPLTA